VKPLSVLIGCECSGRVRRAFRARGHNAWSCDLQPAEDGSPFHIHGDVLDQLQPGRWDIGIFHPDCTYLCNSGVRWLHERTGRWALMEQACAFFLKLWNAPIDRVAVENPVMHGHAKRLIGVQQTQTVQPWWFGDPEKKATCLWLRGLTPLIPTCPVLPLHASVHREAPGPERKRNRSRTFQGFADAMAMRWAPDISSAKGAA
jgi:hypothetical protein